MESCVSVETPKDPSETVTPMFPYLLWFSNDFLSGELYLKIDKKHFHVGSYVNGEDAVLRAFTLSFKAYSVLNLEYHPYLVTVYNYMEILCEMGSPPLVPVTKFITAIHALAQKE